MSSEIAFQRLYDRIELITGVGDARLGKLCIMSFVSLLAGESFGDRPKTASQVIRKFAIPINDRMDDTGRQRLKPFAPRIVGTNDGYDEARGALLYRAVMEEILPGIPLHEAQLRDEAALVAKIGTRAAGNLQHIQASWRTRRYDVLAKETGHLIAALSERTSDTRLRSWYWHLAIDLLDRLCDVGRAARLPRDTAHAPTRRHQAE